MAWLIALVSWPVGYVTQFTAVIPSAAAAFAAALVIFGLGREMFGAEAGKYAALIAVTTQGAFQYSRIPMPDMLMTAFITASLWWLWRMTRGMPHAWIGFYVFVGLAFWTKGPGGFLPLAVALAWALVGRSGASWRALRLPFGFRCSRWSSRPGPSSGSSVTPRGCARRSSTTSSSGTCHTNFARAWSRSPSRTPSGSSFRGCFVLPLALVEAARLVRRRGAERDAIVFLVVALASMFVVIALSQQQRFRYYLPLVAPAALLVGWWAEGVLGRRIVLKIPWRVAAVVAVLLAAAGIAGAFSRRNALSELAMVWPAYVAQAVVLVVTVAAIAVALIRGAPDRRLARGFAAAWVGCALLVMSSYHWELERRNAAYDYAGLRERMTPLLRESPVVATLGLADMPLAFYLRRPVVPAGTAGNLREVVRGDAPAVAIVTDRALTSLEAGGGFTVLLHDRLALRPIAVVAYRTTPSTRP